MCKFACLTCICYQPLDFYHPLFLNGSLFKTVYIFKYIICKEISSLKIVRFEL